jgi:tRNA A64-2'-O-ribosylphosphate transferase
MEPPLHVHGNQPTMATENLIFPLLSGNTSHTLSALRRSTLTLSNRLRSIAADAEHVCAVADAFGLPLVANERCGRWYVPGERRAESVYFKSTDGHAGQWAFSSRRLNLHLLDVVARCGGYVEGTDCGLG